MLDSILCTSSSSRQEVELLSKLGSNIKIADQAAGGWARRASRILEYRTWVSIPRPPTATQVGWAWPELLSVLPLQLHQLLKGCDCDVLQWEAGVWVTWWPSRVNGHCTPSQPIPSCGYQSLCGKELFRGVSGIGDPPEAQPILSPHLAWSLLPGILPLAHASN